MNAYETKMNTNYTSDEGRRPEEKVEGEADKLYEAISRFEGGTRTGAEIKAASYARWNKMMRRSDFFEGLKNFFEPIICTPLAILFGILTFAGRLAAYISCIGLFVGGWNLYQSFCASGLSLELLKMESFRNGWLYIILPFVAFLLASLLEKIHDFFDLRAF